VDVDQRVTGCDDVFFVISDGHVANDPFSSSCFLLFAHLDRDPDGIVGTDGTIEARSDAAMVAGIGCRCHRGRTGSVASVAVTVFFPGAG